MKADTTAPLRLLCDGGALAANWRAMAAASGPAACGAAVKADGYGLGAVEVVTRLARLGCRDFFVSSWAEADALGPLPEGVRLAVLHGVRAEDMAVARQSPARPVLNSVDQVRRWREAGGGPCDVMVDTGMNRLGLAPAEILEGALDGLSIETLMSHLACADEPGHPLNARQQAVFAGLAGRVDARRRSLANSAGIGLGPDYHFNLTRPGIALYGGRTAPGMEGVRQVARIEAQILQVRRVPAGDSVGYGAVWTAEADTDVAIVHLGYADGYARGFSSRGHARWQGIRLRVIGRVSMDLLAIAVPAGAGEGDWIEIDYDLPRAAEESGLSQYELLTGLGRRYGRRWS